MLLQMIVIVSKILKNNGVKQYLKQINTHSFVKFHTQPIKIFDIGSTHYLPVYCI